MAEQSFSKESLNITQEKLAELKSLFPEVVSEGRIDFERLKLALGQDAQITDERYVLNWANKSDVFTAIQTLTTKTLMPLKEESVNFDTTQNVFIEGENLEALKVLQKSYYGKIKMIYIDPPYNTGNDSFVYPDKFSESKEEYLKKIKEKDEEGYLLKEGLFHKNSQENGQFHSNWLSMMYPRLFLAKNLLRDDGVIFVSIDDNEVHNLRLLMNEIFGEENFRNSVIISRNTSEQTEYADTLNIEKEYILIYSKTSQFEFSSTIVPFNELSLELMDFLKGKSAKKKLQDFCIKELGLASMKAEWKGFYTSKDPRPTMQFPILGICPQGSDNPHRRWIWGRERALQAISNYEKFLKLIPNATNEDLIKYSEETNITDFIRKSPTNSIQYFKFSKDGEVIGDTWKKINTSSGGAAVKELFGKNLFSNPKPVELVKQSMIIGLENTKTDIILDFFAGSGTTAQAVMELNKEDGGNRKFILVQLSEKTDEKSEAYKAGYKNIAEISKERIRRVIKKMEHEQKENPSLFKDGAKLDLGFKSYRLKESNFKLWRSDLTKDAQSLTETIDMFENPVKEDAKEQNILTELMLKSGYDLNAKVETIDVDDSHIYLVNDREHIFCLNKISDAIIVKILELKPQKCLILDSLFDGKDSFKTNVALQMQDAQINLTVV